MQVCHVLRYTPYTQTIKKLVDSGTLGKVINIQHLEPVGHYHYAHSYVRGAITQFEASNSLVTFVWIACLDWFGCLSAGCFIGNWRREDESSFMLLAKCCHDVRTNSSPNQLG